MALPSTSRGSKAWMPRRCSVGARFRKTGCSLMTSSRMSHTWGRRRSTMRLADLMFWASSVSTSRFMTKGLNSSRAMSLGRPHWCRRRAEPALLALEQVGEGLEGAVAGTGDRTAATAVVEQGVDRLLQHALLVVDDDLGRPEIEQPLQPVVAVDHPAVEVVEVGRREAATVELHHGTQVGRDDRHGVEDHGRGVVDPAPGGLIPAVEGGDDLQPLD